MFGCSTAVCAARGSQANLVVQQERKQATLRNAHNNTHPIAGAMDCENLEKKNTMPTREADSDLSRLWMYESSSTRSDDT